MKRTENLKFKDSTESKWNSKGVIIYDLLNVIEHRTRYAKESWTNQKQHPNQSKTKKNKLGKIVQNVRINILLNNDLQKPWLMGDFWLSAFLYGSWVQFFFLLFNFKQYFMVYEIQIVMSIYKIYWKSDMIIHLWNMYDGFNACMMELNDVMESMSLNS